MKKVYEHNFNEKDICQKCHQHRSKIKVTGAFRNVCPVIGKEEVAKFST